MIIDDLVHQVPAWQRSAPDSTITISSRVRLARNLKNALFPEWAGEEERQRVWEQLRDVLATVPTLKGAHVLAMEELDALDRQVLFERHLISREQLDRGPGSGVAVTPDEQWAVMVNEEDHLRMQILRPGLDVMEAWRRMNRLDDEVSERVEYAFSSRLGYLTACPTNVGTGLRASVMLHTPGLVLLGEMEAVIKGINKIGLAVRGLWGEGTEAAGNMFQISNQITLGEKEEDTVANLEQIVQEVVEHEKNARARLLEQRETVLLDHIGRSLGILQNAYILTTKEALDLLSALRLGLEMGILKCRDRKPLDELLVLVQPAHLQKREGRKLKPRARDTVRARWVRQSLAEAGISKTSGR